MMPLIPDEEVVRSVETENPWWSTGTITHRYDDLPRRDYFDPFQALAKNLAVIRAVVLMGPRRVGKTVISQQLIQSLLKEGVPPKAILYASIDTPTYTGLQLKYFVDLLMSQVPKDYKGQRYIVFDEIQYLADWERGLKVLVDNHPEIRFIASGSAAAALKLASVESGAGRFTDFMLPPLTFAEYLRFVNQQGLIIPPGDEGGLYRTTNIVALNEEFVNYINFGGYPEAVMSAAIRSDAARFIKNDIIDKVLLRDLPQLYGITNIQELNKLFTALAYLTGQETSFQNLAQESNGISKPTIERYIEYLEAAFLIFRVRRVDENAKTFARERAFKVFLTNPSMRAALFSPMAADAEGFGHLAETAVLSQWFHSSELSRLHYARWKGREENPEIDIVHLGGDMRPSWAAEVKWSDRRDEFQKAAKNIAKLGKSRGVVATITTKTYEGTLDSDVKCRLLPTALYCYTVGRNTAKDRVQQVIAANQVDGPEQIDMFK